MSTYRTIPQETKDEKEIIGSLTKLGATPLFYTRLFPAIAEAFKTFAYVALERGLCDILQVYRFYGALKFPGFRMSHSLQRCLATGKYRLTIDFEHHSYVITWKIDHDAVLDVKFQYRIYETDTKSIALIHGKFGPLLKSYEGKIMELKNDYLIGKRVMESNVVVDGESVVMTRMYASDLKQFTGGFGDQELAGYRLTDDQGIVKEVMVGTDTGTLKQILQITDDTIITSDNDELINKIVFDEQGRITKFIEKETVIDFTYEKAEYDVELWTMERGMEAIDF